MNGILNKLRILAFVGCVVIVLSAFLSGCGESQRDKEAREAERIMERLDKSKVDAAMLLIDQISSKLGIYSIDIGHYPTEDEGGLNALLTKPAFDDESLAGKWAGPYINRKQLKDPWGKELGYELVDKQKGDTTRQVFHVWSYGRNGEDDSGKGDDIKSW